MSKPNFRQVNSCANCKHVYLHNGQDSQELFCCFDSKPRPQYTGVTPITLEERAEFWEGKISEGQDWQQGRFVEANMICDNYEQHKQHNALVAALEALLDMPSACLRDDEILENNWRREHARAVLLSYGIGGV